MPFHLPSRLAVLTLSAPGLLDTIRDGVTGHRPWDARWSDIIRHGVSAVAERELGSVPPHQIRAHLQGLCDGTAVGWSATEADAGAYAYPRDPDRDGEKPLLARALILLADRLLVWNHGHFRLRASTLLEFQQIVGEVAPDQILMLAAAAERSVNGHLVPRPRWLDRSTLDAILTAPLIPSVDLPIVDALVGRGLAEIHRHIGGSAQPALLWLDLLRDPAALARRVARERDIDPEKRRKFLLHSARLRDARHLRTLLASALLRLGEQRHGEIADDEANASWGQWSRDVWRTLATFGSPVRYGSTPGEAVLLDPAERLLHRALRPPASERALLYYAFRQVLQPPVERTLQAFPQDAFVLALHAYLIQQNHFTRALIQPAAGQEGLERFVVDYYRSPLAAGRGDASGVLEQATDTGRVRWFEGRMGPGRAAPKVSRLLEKTRLLADGQLVGASQVARTPCDRPRGRAPAVGVVLHFTRQPERQPVLHERSVFGLPARFARLRARLWRETFEIMRLDAFRELAPYLVGLDVAGNEVDTPIEVFAPMIRFLRSPFRRRRHVEDSVGPLPLVPPLSLTCHAGEDFRHLLSGMRAVDETLRFLDMRRGDRLGHALSLGVEPQRWAARVGSVVSMPLEERVDDLVWFLDRLARHPELTHVARQAERELNGLARRLYGEIPSTVFGDGRWDLLYRAWSWRRCNPGNETEHSSAWLPSDLLLFLRAERDESRAAFGEDARALWMAHQRDETVRRLGSALIQVPVRSAWLPAMRQIQADMVEALIRRNIAIEINPSSNLAIGPFDDLTEHPVFRWFPPGAARGQAHPFVVVGSDDPGIFATELLHEYAYLARAAEERGAAPRQVADWLEDLRQASVMFSFLPSTGQVDLPLSVDERVSSSP